MAKKALIVTPDKDFDLTEVSVPWKYFKDNHIEVSFSTASGKQAKTDPLLISGVLFGKMGAKPGALNIFKELEQDQKFRNPVSYSEIKPEEFDILLLPGGHARGMRQYLESTILQDKVLEFFQQNKLIGAICHGPLVLARTLNPKTGRSIIFGKKMTALTKSLERTAFFLTFWKLGSYYRTYPAYVEDEIKSVLANNRDFKDGKKFWKPFIVEDGNLVTARWPEDAYVFSRRLVEKLILPE